MSVSNDDDDDSSFQLEIERLISTPEASSDLLEEETRSGSQLQQPPHSSKSDNFHCSIDFDEITSSSSNQQPDLNECYSWLQQNVEREGKKHSSSSSSISSSSSSSSSFVSLPLPTPPDGGWGWMVVFGAFMVGFICDGLAYCFGVLYAELLIQFGESKSKTSLVGSVFFGVAMIFGPFTSAMTTRFGCRKMTILGGLLSSIGFILSYFANSIEMLCITFGVVVGIGFSFCYVTSVVIVAYYFKKRRSLATGMAVCGTGVGTFTFGPLMELLISEYGWRGLFLIMSGISLNLVVCGMLFRPLKFSEAERCNLLLEEFDKISHGRKELEFKRHRESSESTEASSLTDLDNSQDDLRTLSMMSLPTFASGKVRNASTDLLMEALKNSRNPHLTIQRYMKNAMFRLSSHDSKDKDKKGIQCLTENNTCTISIPGTLDSSTHLSISSCNISQSESNKDTPINLDNIFLTPPISGSNTVSVSTPIPRMKRNKVILASNKVSTKSIADPSERLKVPERDDKSFSQSSRISSFNVGRRWAYGIHLPLYRTDIFYRRWQKQNGSLVKPCMLGTSCPELMESCETKSQGNLCQRFAQNLYEELYEIFTGMLKFSLFTNGFFALFVISNFLFYFWSDVPYMYAADHAMNKGSDPRDASFIISVIGIFNTVGQVIFGFIGDLKVNLVVLYAIVSVFAGVFVALVPLVTVYWQTCIVYALFGFCVSVGFPLTTILMVNYLGIDKLANAYGLLMLMQGIANLFGPPFAGWVSDTTGSYDWAFYLSGIFYALSGLVMFFIYVPACKSSKFVEEDDQPKDEPEIEKL